MFVNSKDPEWLRKQHTLRGQLLALVHDMDEHPREGPSLEALKSVAFWPKMGADMSEHWWSCADCLPEVRALKGIGTGIMALRRFTVLQLDHFKLPGAWAEMCGVNEILTITDSATRITSYEVVEGQSAQQTARVLYDRWIPYYGTPEALITDPHPGFASEVMNELRKLLGIREHEKAAPREKSKTVDVESRHNNLKRILTNGFMKGDVKSPKDLQTYCQKAKMRHDFGEANDVSPFECATGQMPSPGRNMAMVPPEKAKERVRSMHMGCRACRKEEEGDMDNRVHQRGAGIPWMRTEHRTDDEAEDRGSEKSRSDDEIDQSDNARKSDSQSNDPSTEGNNAMLRERHGLKQEGERNEARQTKEKASSEKLISKDEEMTAGGEGVVPAHRQGISIMHAQVHTAAANGNKYSVSEIDEKGFLKWLRAEQRGSTEEKKEHASAHQGWGEDTLATEEGERLVSAMVQKATRQQKAQYIYGRCEEIMRGEYHRRDERARDNAIRRDRHAARAPYAYDFKIQAGQEVDYLGDAWRVIQLEGNKTSPGQATIIRKGGGKEKRVMVADLRPAATPRAAKFLPGQELKINEEDFVIFECEESITMGIVMGVSKEECEVHEYASNEKMSVWLPLWRGPPPVNKQVRKGTCPGAKFLPETVSVPLHTIIARGNLTASGRLDEAARKEVMARGLTTTKA